MKITIQTIGTLKEKALQDIAKEYLMRLNPFTKISIVESREESSKSTHEKATILEREAKLLRTKKKKGNEVIIVLDEKGSELSSKEFAQYLSQKTTRGEEVVFIIGGPLGVDPELKKKADLVLSLSRLTFTHQMVRVFLLEQIYRACMINTGRKYHND